jgi:diguanylate cyclase (GGDEF)-like protein
VSDNGYEEIIDEVEVDDDAGVIAPGANQRDPYDDVIDNQFGDKSALQQSMFAAADGEPDRRAKAIELSNQTNLPVDIVERNFDEINKKAQRESFDYDDVISSSPMLAKWMQDPDNATLAKDDVPNLQNIEKQVDDFSLTSGLYSALSSGMASTNAAIARIPSLIYSAAAIPQNIIAEKTGIKSLEARPPEWLINNPVARYYDGQAKALEVPEMHGDAIKEIGKGNYAQAGKVIAMQVAANTPQLAAIIATAYASGGSSLAGGALAGGMAGADKLKANEDAGVDPVTSATSALAHGTFEAAFEKLGTLSFFSKASATIAKQYGKSAAKEAFKSVASTLAKGAGIEGAEEWGTSFAQDLTDYATGVNPDALDGIFHRANNAALLGGVMGGGITAPSAIATGVAKSQDVQQAERAKEFYTALGETAEASKLRERLPSKQRELVESIVKGGSVENIFIPVQALETFFQGPKGSATAAMQEIGALEAYTEAQETGADVQIPLATWIEKVVGTDIYKGLANDVKFDPGQMTVNQAKEAAKEQASAMAEEAKKSEAAPQDEQALDVSAAEVGQTIAQQLEAMGEDPQAAIIHEQAFRSLGERMGADPMELFKEHRLQVQAENGNPIAQFAAGKTYNQPFIPEEMSREELIARVKQLETEARVSPVTGVRNQKAFDEDASLNWPTVSAIDMDGLKRLNDAVGHEAADKVLKALGAALIQAQAEGDAVRFYHRSGDEFAARFKESTHAEAFMARVQEELEHVGIKITVNGKAYVYEGIGISFGTGESYEKADGKANDQKRERLAAGKREDARAHGAPRRLREVPSDSKGSESGSGDLQSSAQDEVKKFDQSAKSKYKIIEEEDSLSIKVGKETSAEGRFLGSDYDWWIDGGSNNSKPSNLPYNNPFVLEDIRVNPKKQGSGIGSGMLSAIIDAAHSNGADAVFTNASPLPVGNSEKGSLEDLIRFYESQGFKVHEKSPNNAVMILDLRGRKFDQKNEDDVRGSISFSPAGAIISLSKSKDASTFFHESGHYFLEVLGSLSSRENAPKQIKDDFDAILKWMGVESKDQIGVEQHEKWARGFEAYIMEGKAPSKALQSAFARFKVWLVSVYRNLKNLNVQLTPEIRGVMDRLLATDLEIAEAQGKQAALPLFQDPAAFGLTGAKAERYLKATEEAREAAEEEVTGKLMKDFNREKEKWWKERRDIIHAEIATEVAKRPVQIALAALKTGKLPDGAELPTELKGVKLSKLAIQTQFEFGPDKLAALPKGVYAVKGGIHPNIAAEFFGLRSGKELLDALATAQNFDAVVDQETDARMREAYPDLLESAQLPEEAIQAVHNDKRAQMLVMELEHLASNNMPVLKDMIRRVARRPPTLKQVRQQAEAILGGKLVGEIKPHLFLRAEAKNARDAGILLAQGDFDGAFLAKQRELLNHELYRASVQAQEDVEATVEKFKVITRPDEKVSKSRDTDLANAARAVLAVFGLGKPDKPATAYLENIKKYDPDTHATMEALVMSALENAGPYKQVTYDAFVGMKQSVQALWDLAKTSKEMEVDGKLLARDEAIAELEGVLANHVTNKDKGYAKAMSKWEKTKMGLLGIKAALRRVESWVDAIDGSENGAFRKYIWNPISEGTAKYREEKQRVLKQYLDLMKPIEAGLTAEEIESSELGYVFSGKAELLGALLHTGNASNFQKLLRGMGWGEIDESGQLNRTRWDAFVNRIISEGKLTKADYDFVQGVWDLMESLKPDTQKAHKKMYGHYFSEITAEAVVTPFGTYKGGYVPAKADPLRSDDAAMRQDKQALDGVGNSFAFPTSGRGATKSRVEAYAAPLQLDLRFIPSHIDWSLRFTHIEPRVKDVARIMTNKDFRKSLGELDPTVVGDMIMPWLQRAATQKLETQSQGAAGRATDTFFREVRRRTGLQVMVGNVVNTMQQVTGFSIAAVKVKPRFLRNSMWAYTQGPKALAEQVTEKSSFMRTRVASQVYDIQATIDDMLLNPSKYEQARAFAQKHGYFMQAGAQNVVDLIVWSGAYDQAIENGATEVEAVRESDAAVRQTQGSFNPEDVSRFETGSPFVRAFTMFYSYFNMQANLLGTEFGKVARELGLKKGAGRALYIYALGFMIPAVMSDLIVKAMSGALDEDDDDQYLDDLAASFFGGQFRTATAFFPVVGPAVQAGINAFNDKWYDDKISTSPSVSMIESAVKAPNSVYKAIAEDGSKKKAIRDFLSALGLLTGVPVVPLARPLGYLSEVSEGNVEPTGPIDFARGLVTGRAPVQR